jgi:Glucokinase regulatory protein N-terminal SIS domain
MRTDDRHTMSGSTPTEQSVPITEQANALTTDLDLASALGCVRLFRQSDAQLFAGFHTYPCVYDLIPQLCALLPVLRPFLISRLASVACASPDDPERYALSPAPRYRVVISGSGTSGRLAYFVCRTFNRLLAELHQRAAASSSASSPSTAASASSSCSSWSSSSASSSCATSSPLFHHLIAGGDRYDNNCTFDLVCVLLDISPLSSLLSLSLSRASLTFLSSVVGRRSSVLSPPLWFVLPVPLLRLPLPVVRLLPVVH